MNEDRERTPEITASSTEDRSVSQIPTLQGILRAATIEERKTESESDFLTQLEQIESNLPPLGSFKTRGRYQDFELLNEVIYLFSQTGKGWQTRLITWLNKHNFVNSDGQPILPPSIYGFLNKYKIKVAKAETKTNWTEDPRAFYVLSLAKKHGLTNEKAGEIASAFGFRTYSKGIESVVTGSAIIGLLNRKVGNITQITLPEIISRLEKLSEGVSADEKKHIEQFVVETIKKTGTKKENDKTTAINSVTREPLRGDETLAQLHTRRMNHRDKVIKKTLELVLGEDTKTITDLHRAVAPEKNIEAEIIKITDHIKEILEDTLSKDTQAPYPLSRAESVGYSPIPEDIRNQIPKESVRVIAGESLVPIKKTSLTVRFGNMTGPTKNWEYIAIRKMIEAIDARGTYPTFVEAFKNRKDGEIRRIELRFYSCVSKGAFKELVLLDEFYIV